MSFDLDRLYRLLPAIYRIRDVEQGDSEQSGPLKALLGVIAGEVAVLEDNLEQLYDDQFIETCAEWVVPYIGDLLAVRGLQAIRPGTFSQRAFVAHTLAYRRRKGTAVALEQLARDVTGWDAHVIEFFQLLATTQSMHHLRPTNLAMPDLRQWEPLERINTPFDSVAHTIDVRRIASGRGRYNIPNIGIFLWRLHAYPLTNSPAFAVDAHRYMFSPLGNNTPLFTHPATEGEFTQLSGLVDVPDPITRRVLDAYLDAAYYDRSFSCYLIENGTKVPIPGAGQKPSDRISVCDLNDVKDAGGNVTGWAHMPVAGGKIAVDPVLGRIAFPPDVTPSDVRVSFYYGFSMDMGGGEYKRSASFDPKLQLLAIQQVPKPHATIQDALNALTGSGVVEIGDSGRYNEALTINAAANQRIELRAADGHRPTLVLNSDLQIEGGENAEVILNGLLISGGTLRVSGTLQHLSLRHCTLVPGLSLDIHGVPQHPATPSLVLQVNPEHPITVEIDHCIVGPLRFPAEGVTLLVKDTIIDAPTVKGQPAVALASSDDGTQPGPATTLERTTVMGTVYVRELSLASACIFTQQLKVDRRQAGCVRFSYVPGGSQTPRRYRCQPDLAIQQALDAALKVNPLLSQSEQDQLADAIRARLKPSFTQEDYGQPAYAQLETTCPLEIRSGADDGAEMGAFHDLYQPQREGNLLSHLDEFLRFGLEAGVLYVT